MGFNRLNISTRIFVGFGTLIVLSLFLAGFGVYELWGVGIDSGKMT
jgi:hypothetical protein